MALLMRLQVVSTGYTGAPGMTTYWGVSNTDPEASSQSEVDSWAADVASVLTAEADQFPSYIDWNSNPEVQLVNSEDGSVVDALVLTSPFSVAAIGGASSQSHATQLVMALRTPKVVNGRFLRGRHFLGPLGDTAMGSDGLVDAGMASALQAAYGALTPGTDCALAVWHRPSAPGASDGDYALVNEVIARRKPGVLRSRRD